MVQFHPAGPKIGDNMKSGTYTIGFNVDLTGCETEEEAQVAVREMCRNLLEDDNFPEVELHFVEGTELDYTLDDDEFQELNFG